MTGMRVQDAGAQLRAEVGSAVAACDPSATGSTLRIAPVALPQGDLRRPPGGPRDLQTRRRPPEGPADAAPDRSRPTQAGALDAQTIAHGLPAGTPAAPVYLTRALGARPAQRRAARLWDNAARRIDEHRQRWDITDPDEALGGEPASAQEAADRRIIQRTLQRTEAMIARALEPPGPSIDPGR